VNRARPDDTALPGVTPTRRARSRWLVLAPVTAVLLLAGCGGGDGGDDVGGGAAAGAGGAAAEGKDASLCKVLSEQQVADIVKQELKPPGVESDGSGCSYFPVEVKDGKEIVVQVKGWPKSDATRVQRAVLVPEIGPEAVVGNNGSQGTAITQFPQGDRVIEVSLGATDFEPTKELLARSRALGTALAQELGAARPVTQESGPQSVAAGRSMCSVVKVADVNAALGTKVLTAQPPYAPGQEHKMCTYRTAEGAKPYSTVTITVTPPSGSGEPGEGEPAPELGPGAAAGTYPLGAWASFPTTDDMIVDVTWASRAARSPEAQQGLATLAKQLRDKLSG
jgi:hypothetical protein